jgi:hypothetical protein
MRCVPLKKGRKGQGKGRVTGRAGIGKKGAACKWGVSRKTGYCRTPKAGRRHIKYLKKLAYHNAMKRGESAMERMTAKKAGPAAPRRGRSSGRVPSHEAGRP